jgi:hypothetical protein
MDRDGWPGFSGAMGINRHPYRSRQFRAILPVAQTVSASLLNAYPLEARSRDFQYEKKTDRGGLCAREFPNRPRRLVPASRFPHPIKSQRSALHRRMIRVSVFLACLPSVIRTARSYLVSRNQISRKSSNSTSTADDLDFDPLGKEIEHFNFAVGLARSNGDMEE